tara:strand:+ start:88 stop:378 length:291 start_codon:yes stop_codon:yes gene_type:complete
MELVMMDQNTANRVIHQKNKDLYKVDVFQLQHEIKQKENKEKKLKQTIKIMIVSFVFLTTIMISNLDKLSEIENKMFKWWIKLPEIIEHPFNKNLK